MAWIGYLSKWSFARCDIVVADVRFYYDLKYRPICMIFVDLTLFAARKLVVFFRHI